MLMRIRAVRTRCPNRRGRRAATACTRRPDRRGRHTATACAMRPHGAARSTVLAVSVMLLLTLAAAVVVTACGDDGRPDAQARAEQALARHADELRALPGVMAIGTRQEGPDQFVLTVTVTLGEKGPDDAYPSELDGIPVVVDVHDPEQFKADINGVIVRYQPRRAGDADDVVCRILVRADSMENSRHRRAWVVVTAATRVWEPVGEGARDVAAGPDTLRAGRLVTSHFTEDAAPGATTVEGTAKDVMVYDAQAP